MFFVGDLVWGKMGSCTLTLTLEKGKIGAMRILTSYQWIIVVECKECSPMLLSSVLPQFPNVRSLLFSTVGLVPNAFFKICFMAQLVKHQAEAPRLDEAIWKNRKEVGDGV